MGYFNYHAIAKRMILQGKLKGFYYTARYGVIAPALVLMFRDEVHPIMPIRKEKWWKYEPFLDKRLELKEHER